MFCELAVLCQRCIRMHVNVRRGTLLVALLATRSWRVITTLFISITIATHQEGCRISQFSRGLVFVAAQATTFPRSVDCVLLSPVR